MLLHPDGANFIVKLVEFGFLPIITAARTWRDEDEQEVVGDFIEMLKQRGNIRPRLKILPLLRIGAEENRCGGYADTERVTGEMMEGFDQSQLICEHSRIVTDRGVFVCPILIESPDARLGDTLAESARPYQIKHGACYTCYQYGAICSKGRQFLHECAERIAECTGETLSVAADHLHCAFSRRCDAAPFVRDLRNLHSSKIY